MEVPSIAALIVLGLIGVIVAIWFLGRALAGAIFLFAWAMEQGFLGAVAFFAAWVFLLPVMLVSSFVIGVWFVGSTKKEGQDAKRVSQGQPPKDPDKRYRWANRLPPYD